MATPAEVDLITRLRDSLLTIFTPAIRAANPAAVQAANDATAWLLNPDVDQEGAEPVFPFEVTINNVTHKCMTDKRRRVWRLDVPTRRWVLL